MKTNNQTTKKTKDALLLIFKKSDKVTFHNKEYDLDRKTVVYDHNEGYSGGYYIDRTIYLYGTKLGLKKVKTKRISEEWKDVRIISELLHSLRLKAIPSHLVIKTSKDVYIHNWKPGGGHSTNQREDKENIAIYCLTSKQKKLLKRSGKS